MVLALLWHKGFEIVGIRDELTRFLLDGPEMHLKWSCNDDFLVSCDEVSVLGVSCIALMWNE